jgi:ComF family protein
LARSAAAFVHGGAIARAIHRFKYEDQPELASPLAELLSQRCATYLLEAPALVCAVPLHVSRLRSRRYDQAELIARALARRTKRTFLAGALHRERDTPRQVELSEPERERNMAGAFRAEARVAGRSLLLVDDVITTGATARAAAGALRNAGARDVWLLAVARA